MYSLVSVFCFRHFPVKQLKSEIYIILCGYPYHSLSRILKIKLVELTFRTAKMYFLSSSYGNESHKSVGCAKYTTLNMVIFLHLIGRKRKEVGGSWAYKRNFAKNSFHSLI